MSLLQEARAIINESLNLLIRKDTKELDKRIWEAHFKLEYSIGLLKMRADSLPLWDGKGEKMEMEDALVSALNSIDKAMDLIGKKKIGDAIKELRKARDNLKFLFVDLRKNKRINS